MFFRTVHMITAIIAFLSVVAFTQASAQVEAAPIVIEKVDSLAARVSQMDVVHLLGYIALLSVGALVLQSLWISRKLMVLVEESNKTMQSVQDELQLCHRVAGAK